MKLTLPKSVLFSVLSASASFVASTPADDNIFITEKIVGGKPAKPGDYPYFVGMGGCGGALVAPDVVLTARHCGSYKGRVIIIGAYERGGSLAGGAQKRTCKEWVKDPSDSNSVLASDFALCKLDKPVEIDESKIRLELNAAISVPEEGDDLKVVGLGRTSSGGSTPDTLRHVEVPYVTNQKCNEKNLYNGQISEKMLCAGFLEGGKDSCQGDSGGPIVKRTVNGDGIAVHTHVGVVSWGSGCAQPNKPGVYARTSERFDWIKKTMCDDFKSVASFCSNSPAPSPPAPNPPAPNPPAPSSLAPSTPAPNPPATEPTKSPTCPPDPTKAPAPNPNPNESCEDSKDFRWKNKRDCKKYLIGRNKERVKKKCNKEHKGDFVYNWCPASCAKKVDVGPCA